MELLEEIANFKPSLLLLKQLWASKANENSMKQAIWSFKKKIPIVIEQSVLAFCFSEQYSINRQQNQSLVVPNANIFQNGCRIFRDIDCIHSAFKKIEGLEELLKSEDKLPDKQSDICMFNLACLYESINMNAKALRILEKIKFNSNLDFLCNFKAKLYLKTKQRRGDNQKQSQMINRYAKITNALEHIPSILDFRSCKLYEIFNIGLCFKKQRNYKVALALFQFISEQTQEQDKFSVFSKLNMSECYFGLGDTVSAIVILQALAESELFILEHYKKEIWIKINSWSRTSQILQSASSFGETILKEAKNLIFNWNTNQTGQLFKTKRIMIIKDKERELEKLVGQSNSTTDITMKETKNSSLPSVYKLCIKKKNKYSFPNTVSRRDKTLLSGIKFDKRENLKKVSMVDQSVPDEQSSRQTSDYSSQTGRSEYHNHLDLHHIIQHHQTIIKNSQNEAQVAENYLGLGDAYLRYGDYEKSEISYKKALEKGRFEAYSRIGNIHYQQQDLRQALESYEKYLKHVDSSDREIKIKMLHCYSKFPEYYRNACDKLKEMLASDPFDKEAHILYVTVLMKQNYILRAIEACEEFTKLKYSCFENHHLLGLLYKQLKKYVPAYQRFITALRMNPCYIVSLLQLLELVNVDNFIPEIIQIYKKALLISRENHEIIQILKQLIETKTVDFQIIKHSLLTFSELVEIGDFFLEREMVNEAEYCYEEASKYTNNTLLKEKLGDLQYAKNNFEEAEKLYRQSQLRKPIFKIQVKLADCLIKQQKLEEARKILNDCLAKESQSKSLCLNLMGQCEYGLGNFEAALSKFKQSSNCGYILKINQVWEQRCHRRILEGLKTFTFNRQF